MNDSFGKISSPVPPQSNGGTGRGAQIVQIISLPENLQTITKALRLDGQVTQINNNGTARILTSEGEVEVKAKRNKPLKVGQRLEVDIPAGRPARQASIRNAPVSSSPVPQSSAPQQQNTQPPPSGLQTRITAAPPSASSQQTTQQAAQQAVQTAQQNAQPTGTPPRPTPQTPLPPNIHETVAQINNPNATAPQPGALAQEAIVRLLSVPPAQAQTIASDYIQTLPQLQNNIVARVSFVSNLIVQNAAAQQTQSLLQIVTPPTPSPPTNILATALNNSLQNIAQPVQNIVLSPTLATTSTVLTQTTTTANFATLNPLQNIAPTLPATQTLPPTLATNLLSSTSAAATFTPPIIQPNAPISQPTTLTLVPVTFDTNNPNTLVPARIAQIDIQVLKITPPVPFLNTPPSDGNTALPPQSIPATTTFTPPLISTNNAVTLTAQVTGFTHQGLPLVTARFPNTPLPQSFILQQNVNNLQLGSQIQFIPKSVPVTIQTPHPLNTTSLLQGFQWPALDELYNGLLQIIPQAAASLARTLPNAGNPGQIGPAAMMFIAAVRSGDITAWLGDKKLDLLQRAVKTDLINRLSQNIANTARGPAPDPATTSDWRAVPLPMFWEGEIHKITLYTRHENGENKRDHQEKGKTRFIFDLSLSRMGNIQIDGLLRDKRLDLVVRAHNAFSVAMQQTMRQAYSAALDQTDLTGELNFQGGTKNWVHVLEEKSQLGVHV
ncbi:MAG: hypothetical protein R3D88_02480 [Alphaproteobacteria bacterium]